MRTPAEHTLNASPPGAVDEAESGPGAHIVALQMQRQASYGAPHIAWQVVRGLGGVAAGTPPGRHALSGVLSRSGCRRHVSGCTGSEASAGPCTAAAVVLQHAEEDCDQIA